jgi:SAM-dependent methyltransferase
MKLKLCNLCGFPIIKVNSTVFGTRCVRCQSTFIHRAMGKVINSLNVDRDAKVHEFSQHGALWKYLKRNFRNLSSSEYYEDVIPGEYKQGVQCQDLQSLTFDDNSFGLVTSTEVFEHVPDDKRGFSEVLRVLTSGGLFVFSVPMSGSYKTVQRASIIDGQIVHLMEPEYHGDHLRRQGVLAFRNYGFDLKDFLKEIGFINVDIKLVQDTRRGIVPPVHIFTAEKG